MCRSTICAISLSVTPSLDSRSALSRTIRFARVRASRARRPSSLAASAARSSEHSMASRSSRLGSTTRSMNAPFRTLQRQARRPPHVRLTYYVRIARVDVDAFQLPRQADMRFLPRANAFASSRDSIVKRRIASTFWTPRPASPALTCVRRTQGPPQGPVQAPHQYAMTDSRRMACRTGGRLERWKTVLLLQEI